jgi:glycerol-3-phosphate O-acyltransferase
MKLKELEGKGSLVLTPNHISYMDFLILSYIFYSYGLKVPHISSTEDFLNITFINRILRASGAFFVKKKFPNSNKLYRAILGEYMKHLITNDCNIELFIETSRTRSGKLSNPKNEVNKNFY